MDERELVQRGYRYALALCHDPADAEDLVQAACARLFERRGALGPLGYLLTTIRNLFVDGRRRAKVLAFRPLEDSPEPTEPPRTTTAEGDLERLLAALRPEERETIYLHAVEGYSAREIGERTGRPRGTVLSQLHRARAKLADAVSILDAPRPAVDETHEGSRR